MQGPARTAIFLVPAAMLLIAIAPLPYGYYTLLRLVVTAAALATIWVDYQEKEQVGIWMIGFGIVALLFNPLVPVYLSRSVWLYLDIAAAGMFLGKWTLDRARIA